MIVAPTNLARPSALLAGLFPPSVFSYELKGTADTAGLLPEEIASCVGFRPRRLSEFAAGRLCARRALGDLGLWNFPLRRNADRTPRWPDHVVGSITHTVGFCGAVAALRTSFAGVGVDAEIASRVTGDLWTHVFTPAECEGLLRIAEDRRAAVAATLFSAKEAFYKAQFSVTRQWLDYTDVAVELRPAHDGAGAFGVAPASDHARRSLRGVRADGRYRIAGPLVATGAVIACGDRRPRAVSGLS